MIASTGTGRSLLRRRPLLAFLLAGYVVLLPWQVELSSGTRIAPSDLVLAVLLLAAAPHLRLTPANWSIWHSLTVALMPASALYVLVRYGSVSSWAILNKVVGIGVLAGGFVAVVSLVRTRGDFRWIARIFIGSVAAFNVVALGLYVVGARIPHINVDAFRLSGGLVDPNAWGGLLVLTLVLHLFLRSGAVPNFGPLVDAAVSVSLGVGVALTQSRSAIIGLFVCVIVWATVSVRRMARLYAAGLALAVALAVVSTAGWFQAVFSELARPSTISSRVVLLEYGLRSFLADPLFGIGLGVFEERYGIIVHSTLFWFAAEMGLVGVAVFTGLVVWTMRRALLIQQVGIGHMARFGAALGYAHLAMLGVSMGIEAFYQRHWWLVMAWIAAASAWDTHEGESGPGFGPPHLLSTTTSAVPRRKPYLP